MPDRTERIAAVLAGHCEIRYATRYTVEECEGFGRSFLARCDADGLNTRSGYMARAEALIAMIDDMRRGGS